jgi:hypothetical protein
MMVGVVRLRASSRRSQANCSGPMPVPNFGWSVAAGIEPAQAEGVAEAVELLLLLVPFCDQVAALGLGHVAEIVVVVAGNGDERLVEPGEKGAHRRVLGLAAVDLADIAQGHHQVHIVPAVHPGAQPFLVGQVGAGQVRVAEQDDAAAGPAGGAG